MKSFMSILILFVCGFVFAQAPIVDDLNAFQGEWKNVVTDENGNNLTPDELAVEGRTLFIQGNKFRMERFKNGKFGFHSGNFRLDTKNNFFDMDEPGNPDLIYTGLYEVDGDTLKLCYRIYMKGNPPKERPTKVGIEEQPVLYYEYRRVK